MLTTMVADTDASQAMRRSVPAHSSSQHSDLRDLDWISNQKEVSRSLEPLVYDDGRSSPRLTWIGVVI